MFKSLTLTGITMMLLSVAYAQTTTTLYYDGNWKGLDSKKKATYYRDVVLDDNDKPVGTFKTFYKSGKLYSTAQALRLDKLNDVNTVYNGNVQCYTEKGKLIKDLNYDDSGNLDGLITTYNEDGNRKEVRELSHGNPVKDYYLVYEKDNQPVKYSYLTYLPLKLATSGKKLAPITERKVIYRDGQTIQYYFFDGLSVAVQFTMDGNYGKYYSAYITIENGTDKQFDFTPAEITAVVSNKGEVEEAEIMSYEAYMKKVNRRQAWSAAFNAFAEQQAANQAGYSSSSTVAATAGSSTTGIYSGSRLAYINTDAVAVGASNTQSYNGAAQYAAKQNASNNIAQYNKNQYTIRQSITQGYLKVNTIFPSSRVIGYVNIKYQKGDGIALNVPVNGLVYQFGGSGL